MTLRAKSRGQQWARWLIAAALARCVYVVAFRVLYERALGDVFGAMQLRVLIPVLAAFGAFAYAMRRGWTVEAYYWLWRAKKGGMCDLERTMLQVRSVWANGGFRRESANEYEFFSHEQGTVGYALLCIDARHDADAAKSWLAERAPDFLS